MFELAHGVETEEQLRSEVTRLRRVLIERTEALLSARKDLGSLERMKRDFIALISHELRTPLTSVLGNAELIAMGDFESKDDLQQMAGTIVAEASRLSRFLDDVIEFLQWASGLVSLRLAPFDIAQCVREAAGCAAAPYSGKRLRIEFRGKESLEVVGESGAIENCLVRVIDNACKFSPPGGKVEIAVESINSLGFDVESRAVISVRDEGPGIPAENLHDLYKVLTLCHSYQNHTKGRGLGLSICSEILKAHGGAIRVESPGAGKGCQVVISLSRSPGAPALGPTEA